MVAVTRSDATALEHILSILLAQPPSTDLVVPPFRGYLTTAGVNNASDFISMDPSDYGSILFATSKDGDADQMLNLIQVKKLDSLFLWFRSATPTPATRWFELDADAFQAWRTRPITNSVPPTIPPLAIITPSSVIHDFQKGIKRSVSDYKPFKEDRLWHAWHRHLLTTARAQNVEKVLDLHYTPTSPEAIALLAEQHKFVFSVFEQTVLTSDGLVFVRIHSATGDATAVFRAMVERYGRSTAAQLSAAEIEGDLSTFRLDSTWKRTNLAFLNAWTTKTLDLDLVLATPSSEAQKRIWFTRSIASKTLLAMSISQFEASSKLTALAMGPSYTPPPFSTLFDHVKDDAIRLDSTERLQALSSRRVHEAVITPPGGAPSTAGDLPSDLGKGGSRFIGKDGRPYNHLIPPDQWRKMTHAERTLELQRRKDARSNLAIHRAVTTPPAPAPAPAPTSMISYASMADPSITPSVISSLPAPSFVPSTSSVVAPPTNNLIRRILSANQTPTHSATVSLPPANPTPPLGSDVVQIEGRFYRRINNTNVHYHLSAHETKPSLSSLMDGGANGGMTGNDVVVISTSDFHKANITGIGDSELTDLPLVTAAGLVQTHRGPAIVILHQYAHYGKGHTIHSASQLRAFGTLVHEAPRCLGGQQRLVTPDGYHIPLSYRSGLPHMDMRPPTDGEYATLPHILLTSDAPWLPSSLDDEFSCDDLALDAPHDQYTLDLDTRLNDYGEYTGNIDDDIDLIIHHCCHTRYLGLDFDLSGPLFDDDDPDTTPLFINRRHVSAQAPNLEVIRPLFGWVPLDCIKKTILATTQFARASARLPFRKHFRSRFPACNVERWNEEVATDTFFCDTPAHDDGILGHGGATMAQLYVGKDSTKTVVYPMRKESEMAGTLEDLIRKHGAPNSLFSDNAKAQCGKRVQDILRMYAIKDFQCEPHHQHQNYAERKIGDTKRLCGSIMDRTGTPAKYWLLCLFYSVFLLNHLASDALGGLTPLEVATGQRPDISALLQFRWYEPILYATDPTFPSTSNGKSGHWMGIADNQGDALTYKILTDDTQQVITRSTVRSALNPHNPNLRTSFGVGETNEPILFSASDLSGLNVDPPNLKLPHFSPDELVGLTFIHDTADGQKFRAKVARKIVDHDAANHQKIRFLVEMSNGQLDEILAYNELSDIIERQHEAELYAPEDATWAFKAITDHQGPLKSSDPRYKGSSYNVLVHWEDGSETYEPLALITKSDHVTCTEYASDNGLLATPGWKQLNRIASRMIKFARMIKQAKMNQNRHGPSLQVWYSPSKESPRCVQVGYSQWQQSLGNIAWSRNGPN